jgi:hypothetical protein
MELSIPLSKKNEPLFRQVYIKVALRRDTQPFYKTIANALNFHELSSFGLLVRTRRLHRPLWLATVTLRPKVMVFFRPLQRIVGVEPLLTRLTQNPKTRQF